MHEGFVSSNRTAHHILRRLTPAYRKTGEICASTEDLTQNFDLKDNSTYCANSCLTQYLVFTYNVGVELYGSGENGESAAVDIQTTCLGIDTSKYPVVLSQQPASSFLFDSSSSSSNSSSGNSTNTSGPAANGTDTSKPASAASSLKGSLWGMGSIVVAVAIGASVL